MHTLVLEVEIIKAQVIVKRATKNNGIETIVMQKKMKKHAKCDG